MTTLKLFRIVIKGSYSIGFFYLRFPESLRFLGRLVGSCAWSCEPSQAIFPYVLLSQPLYEVKLHSKCSSVLFKVYVLVRHVIFLERKHSDPVYTVHMLYFVCRSSRHRRHLQTGSRVKSFANAAVLLSV